MRGYRGALAYCLALVGLTSLWLGTKSPHPFFVDDASRYHYPGYYDVGRAVLHGELPLVSTGVWNSGNLAGEYQYGNFSVFLALLYAAAHALTSLHAQAQAIGTVHILVAATGGLYLARALGCRPEAGAWLAIAASLNGALLCQGCQWPAAWHAFAWIPWFWGALWNGRPALAGFFLYLVLAAGWPFCVLMTVLIGIAHAWLRPHQRKALLAAFLLGVLGSAPAWIGLVEFKPFCIRELLTSAESPWTLSLPVSGLGGLLVPDFPVDYQQGGLYAEKVLAGLWVSLLLVVGAGKPEGRLGRTLAALTVLTLLLSWLPKVGPIRYGFRWLPLTHLSLGMLAALSFPRLRRIPAWLALPPLLCGAGCYVWVGSLRLVAEGCLTAGLTLAMARSLRRPALLVTFGTALTLMPWLFGAPPLYKNLAADEWAVDPKPLEIGRVYLDLTPDLTPNGYMKREGNVPLWAGLTFVNGYSPLGPRGLYAMMKWRHDGQVYDPQPILHSDTLEVLGVNGLLLAVADYDRMPAAFQAAWQPQVQGDGNLLVHRAQPIPSVRWLGGDNPPPQLVEWGRNRVRCRVGPLAQAGTLLFSRAYYPGYAAFLDGRPLPVSAYRDAIPAVELAAGSRGLMELVFRPKAVTVGFPLACLALVGGLWTARRRASSEP